MLDTAIKLWGNFGPMEFYVVGADKLIIAAVCFYLKKRAGKVQLLYRVDYLFNVVVLPIKAIRYGVTRCMPDNSPSNALGNICSL